MRGPGTHLFIPISGRRVRRSGADAARIRRLVMRRTARRSWVTAEGWLMVQNLVPQEGARKLEGA
jgi:hypothetical protein